MKKRTKKAGLLRSRVIRGLTLLFLAGSLAGCVHYYYPEPDVLIIEEPARSGYGGFTVGAYPGYGLYPWWSVDWFYLGSGYRYPYYADYYPWYGWSPVYAWGHVHTAWCPPYWRYPHLRHHGDGHRYGTDFAATPRLPVGPDPRPPGMLPSDWRLGLGADPPRDFEERRFDRRTVIGGQTVIDGRPYRQSVLTRPRGGDSRTGLVVRSDGAGKPSRSVVRPVVTGKPGTVKSPAPAYRVSRPARPTTRPAARPAPRPRAAPSRSPRPPVARPPKPPSDQR